jgi:hypothetical protein
MPSVRDALLPQKEKGTASPFPLPCLIDSTKHFSLKNHRPMPILSLMPFGIAEED